MTDQDPNPGPAEQERIEQERAECFRRPSRSAGGAQPLPRSSVRKAGRAPTGEDGGAQPLPRNSVRKAGRAPTKKKKKKKKKASSSATRTPAAEKPVPGTAPPARAGPPGRPPP